MKTLDGSRGYPGASLNNNSQLGSITCSTRHRSRNDGASRGSERSVNNTIDQFPIIVHCHLRWDFVWQRPQHIFSRLAANHPVLFIEEPLWGAGEPSLEITSPQSNVFRVVPILPHELDPSVDAQCEAVLPLLQHALDADPLLAG